MKKLLYIVLLALTAGQGYGQSLDQLISKADAAFNNSEFEKASTLYNKALEISPESSVLKEKLASLYMQPGKMMNTDMAMRYLEDAYKTGKMSPVMQARYVSMLESQRNFDKASEIFAASNRSSRVKNSLVGLADNSYYNRISAPKAGMILRNLREVNSEFSDFSPMFYRSGLSFVSTRTNRSNTGFKMNQIRENYSDLFTTNLTNVENQTFDKPTVMVGNKDLKYMQGPMTFTGDQNNMYLTRSFMNEGKEKALPSGADNRTVMLEIAKSTYNLNGNSTWSEAVPIVLNKAAAAQNFSYAHPAFLNPSGTEMIFSSNMPGGYGGTDLYYTYLIGADWSTPVNLGPEINTGGEEMFPYLAKDGTLYFASSGLPGLGGLDIFKATGSKSNFVNPENVGAPLNSPYDDFGLIARENGNEGYLTSNRPNGVGDDDIYYWKNPECMIALRVYDAKTKAPLPSSNVKIPCTGKSFVTDSRGMANVPCFNMATCDVAATSLGYNNKNMSLKNMGDVKVIEIPMDREAVATPGTPAGCRLIVLVLDKETNLPIEGADVNIKGLTSSDAVTGVTKNDGRVKISGVDANETYRVSASKSNDDGSKYIGNTETMSCRSAKDANGDIVAKIYLTRARVGSKFKIENIYYDLDKWNIKPRAAQELDNIVSIMKAYPTMEIEMGSHTDCRATIKYNEVLSGKRAASSMEYIISKGVERSRMTSKGYGESELTNGCACEGTLKSTCTEDQHQANRRTEFKILKF